MIALFFVALLIAMNMDPMCYQGSKVTMFKTFHNAVADTSNTTTVRPIDLNVDDRYSMSALIRTVQDKEKVINKRELRIQELVRGIKSTHPRMVSLARARLFAEKALDTVALPKYKWLPVEVLLGVAANESDFRPHLVCENGKQDPKGWDCGPYQTRVTVFEGGRTRRARKLCRRLTKDVGLAARYAAREMTGYKHRYCRNQLLKIAKVWKRGRRRPMLISKFWRCVLNAYNQGPRYFRQEYCGSAKCDLHSRYWARVTCWANGIKNAKKIRWSYKCRKARGLRWIKKAHHGKFTVFAGEH